MKKITTKWYTLIATANINGFAFGACEVVKRKDGNVTGCGTINTKKFERYIKESVVLILGQLTKDEDNSIIPLDNASIHTSEQVKELIRDAGAKSLFTALHSPHLNPIECFFSTHKTKLKQLGKPKNENLVLLILGGIKGSLS